MKLEIVKENEKISLQDVQEVENKYQVSFTNDYKNFLLKTNGGEPKELMAFKINTEHVQPFRIMEFYSLERVEEILGYVKDDTEKFLADNNDPSVTFYKNFKNKMIEIAETYTDLDICICYSDENNGKVYCVDSTHDDEFILLSKSFDEFINNFTLVTEEELETGVFKFQSK